MKGFERKVNPYSELHYGESSVEDDKERTRKRIQKYLDKEWYESWFSATRRVLMERMLREKFNAYARVLEILTEKNGIQVSQETVQFSTNRNGGHSWYVTLGVDEEHSQDLVAKITDHLTNRLQTETRDGGYITETYVIGEDASTVTICRTDVNELGDRYFADDGREVLVDIPIEEFAREDWDYDVAYEVQCAKEEKERREKEQQERLRAEEERQKWLYDGGVCLYDQEAEKYQDPWIDKYRDIEGLRKVSRTLYSSDVKISRLPQECIDQFTTFASSLEDYSHGDAFEYSHLRIVGGGLETSVRNFETQALERVGGYLNLKRAERVSSTSLRAIKKCIFAQTASTLILPNIEMVDKIFLTKARFGEFWEGDTFLWEEAEKAGRLVIPKEMRDTIFWTGN